MLLLARNIGETIVVADEIKITVLQINGKQVRIGVDAPKDVAVHREEIYQKIKVQKTSLEASGKSWVTGTVSKKVSDKGYGFIYSPGVGDSIFFHASSMAEGQFEAVEEGTELEFTLARSGKGIAAENIALIEHSLG